MYITPPPYKHFLKFMQCMALGLVFSACQPQALPVQPEPVSSAASVNGPVTETGSNVQPRPSAPSMFTSPAAQLPAPAASASPQLTPQPTPSVTSTGSSTSTASGSTGSSGTSGGGGSFATAPSTPLASPAPTAPPDGRPVLNDLRLLGGGSVLGAQAPAALTPDFAGQTLQIEALGYFFVQPGDTVRLTLDNSIALQLTTVSNTRLVAQLNTAYLADLYLSGPHKLELQTPREAQHHQIRVGSPAQPLALQAQLESVQVIRDANQTPLYLELTGRQLMLNPNFSQVRIGGEVAPVVDSQLAPDGLVTLQIVLPDPALFALPGQHSLQYQDPFSLVFKSFSS